MNERTRLLDKCKSLSMINFKKFSLSSKDFTYLIDNDIIFVDNKFKKAFINLLESNLNKENHNFLNNIISVLMFEEEDISFCVYKTNTTYSLFTMKKVGKDFNLISKFVINGKNSFFIHFSSAESEFLVFDTFFAVNNTNGVLEIKDTVGLVSNFSRQHLNTYISPLVNHYICMQDFLFYVKKDNGDPALMLNAKQKTINVDNMLFLDSLKKYLLKKSSKFDIISPNEYQVLDMLTY